MRAKALNKKIRNRKYKPQPVRRVEIPKENGKMRLEGKDYIMRDGDICYFRFNV